MKQNWTGKRVLIIGAARQGLAMARYLSEHDARVTLNDKTPPEEMKSAQNNLAGLPIRWVLGEHPLGLLSDTDIVCLSGGIPLSLPIVQEAVRQGIPLSNDTQVFLEGVPCPTIGITGSAGKTTTTTLVGRMAEAAVQSPHRAWIGGNIGQPLIQNLDQMNSEDCVIMEISSFQLEQMTLSPNVAAVLNITPNHLDRHGTMEAYTAVKARILAFQGKDHIAVLNREDEGSWGLVNRVNGRLITFGQNKPSPGLAGTYLDGETIRLVDWDGAVHEIGPRSLIELRGEHNLVNGLAACAIGFAAGFPIKALRTGITGFRGVPHRLEFVREYHQANWYNDSIATAPERSMAAIRTFGEPLVLLAGGRDKNLPWEDFAGLVHQRVDHLILFGECAEKIAAAVGPVRPGQRPYSLIHCKTLEEAVKTAADIVEPGDVVLLSPGGTSFDAFKDFEERGEWFRKWVQELT